MTRKKIAILGSTGSIGVNALKVAAAFPARFEVVALSAWGNAALLKEQALKFKPSLLCIKDEGKAGILASSFGGKYKPKVYAGTSGIIKIVRETEAELVLVAVVGSAGLVPVLESIKRGKNVALANKESIVIAGDYVMKLARAKGATILPVDSEHSAIFQCLNGEAHASVRRLILTASGGPFRDLSKKELEKVTVEDALAHPTWDMGSKVTVDSATLMNKGFEVIEAHHLFNMPPERIDVLVHPQSVVHSLVEFSDGSVMAQLGITDMKLPIQYALSWPERINNNLPRLNLPSCGPLAFARPDVARFECLSFAYSALLNGGTMPAVLASSAETAVSAFLSKSAGFMDIPRIIKKVMTAHKTIKNPKLTEILSAGDWARSAAEKEIANDR